MPDRETVVEASELLSVIQEIAPDEVEIARARSRVYALCSHYSDLADGESYTVDIDAGIFRGLMDGLVTCAGPLQVLGTYHAGEFMFAWHNESIVPEAYKDAQEYCLGEPVLAALLAKGKFSCSPANAEKLSQWVAYKMGWHGAFEAPNGAAVAYLLLRLSPCDSLTEETDLNEEESDGALEADGQVDGQCSERAQDLWCSFCGGTSSCVSQLFQASPSCSICNICVRQLVDILHEEEETGNLSEETAPFMVPCLICGDKLPRIFTTHGAVCYSCLRIPAFQAVEA